MKIACIIPDRSDRPQFLEHCIKMLKNQTVKVDHIEVVNYPAESNRPDITQRYRIGYETVSKLGGFDVIFFIENWRSFANRVQVSRWRIVSQINIII